MHGIILLELKEYVETKLGKEVWEKILKESGIGRRIFLPTEVYPDQEVAALVSTASRLTEKSISQILEDFGEFLAPALLALYPHLVKPEWKTLDLIDNTENVIHRVVRVKKPGAKPPELKTHRPSQDEVVITYGSERKMRALAIGIAKGVAAHYRERILTTQRSCMLKGDSVCTISVRLVS